MRQKYLKNAVPMCWIKWRSCQELWNFVLLQLVYKGFQWSISPFNTEYMHFAVVIFLLQHQLSMHTVEKNLSKASSFIKRNLEVRVRLKSLPIMLQKVQICIHWRFGCSLNISIIICKCSGFGVGHLNPYKRIWGNAVRVCYDFSSCKHCCTGWNKKKS